MRAKACQKSTTEGKAKSKAKAKGKAKASVKSKHVGKVVAKGKAEASVKSSKVGKVVKKANAVMKAARIDHEASRQQLLVRCSGEKSQQPPVQWWQSPCAGVGGG